MPVVGLALGLASVALGAASVSPAGAVVAGGLALAVSVMPTLRPGKLRGRRPAVVLLGVAIGLAGIVLGSVDLGGDGRQGARGNVAGGGGTEQDPGYEQYIRPGD